MLNLVCGWLLVYVAAVSGTLSIFSTSSKGLCASVSVYVHFLPAADLIAHPESPPSGGRAPVRSPYAYEGPHARQEQSHRKVILWLLQGGPKKTGLFLEVCNSRIC